MIDEFFILLVSKARLLSVCAIQVKKSFLLYLLLCSLSLNAFGSMNWIRKLLNLTPIMAKNKTVSMEGAQFVKRFVGYLLSDGMTMTESEVSDYFIESLQERNFSAQELLQIREQLKQAYLANLRDASGDNNLSPDVISMQPDVDIARHDVELNNRHVTCVNKLALAFHTISYKLSQQQILEAHQQEIKKAKIRQRKANYSTQTLPGYRRDRSNKNVVKFENNPHFTAKINRLIAESQEEEGWTSLDTPYDIKLLVKEDDEGEQEIVRVSYELAPYGQKLTNAEIRERFSLDETVWTDSKVERAFGVANSTDRAMRVQSMESTLANKLALPGAGKLRQVLGPKSKLINDKLHGRTSSGEATSAMLPAGVQKGVADMLARSAMPEIQIKGAKSTQREFEKKWKTSQYSRAHYNELIHIDRKLAKTLEKDFLSLVYIKPGANNWQKRYKLGSGITQTEKEILYGNLLKKEDKNQAVENGLRKIKENVYEYVD